MINALFPTQEQVRALRDRANDEPIFMLNLLKFRQKAQYEDARLSDLTGQEAYQLYADSFHNIMIPKGARIRFGGKTRGLLIGEGGLLSGEDSGLWDEVAIIEYPNTQVLLDMMRDVEYQKALHHRVAGLEGQLLIECQPNGTVFTP